MKNIEFKYITFKEINGVAKTHPLVYESFKEKNNKVSKFSNLYECPDIRDNFPVFFYLEYKNKMASYIASIPDYLFTNGRKYSLSWGGNLFSDPAFRGKGLATILVDNMVRFLHNKNIGWGGVFATPVSLHIFRKLDYVIPGYADRYLFLKSCRPLIKKYIKSEVYTIFFDYFYRPLARSLYLIFKKKNIDQLINFDCKCVLDPQELLEIKNLNPVYYSKYHFDDSLPKLKFKLKNNENLKLYFITSKSNGKNLLYFVLNNRKIKEPLGGFSDFKLMTLMDYGFYEKDYTYYNILVNYVIELFYNSDAEVLEVISSSKDLNKILKRRLMLKVGNGMSFKFAVPKSWGLDIESKNIDNWHLTHFSGDAYSFQ